MWGKILAGVAIGVGAVAAAPFTGGGSLLGGASLAASLTGAGTIAAAASAGIAGGAIGGAVGNKDKDKLNQAKEEGRTEGKAEVSIEINQLEKQLIAALQKLKSHDEHFRVIIALEAVGVACAACDGEFTNTEKEEIGEFINGMLSQSIPEDVKRKIKYIYDNPPTVKEAFLLAKKSGVSLDIYEDLIRFVIEIDGTKEEEIVFVRSWEQLRAA